MDRQGGGGVSLFLHLSNTDGTLLAILMHFLEALVELRIQMYLVVKLTMKLWSNWPLL